jgi:lipoprotein-anchoring transpeptidase ErfK/SrfK
MRKMMGRKSRVVIAVTFAALALGAVAAYGYDQSRKHLIADGVEASGVALGGLDQAQATRLLRKKVVDPQKRPLKVRVGKEEFVLPAKDLRVRADVDGTVEEALEASREGSLPERVFRYVTGSAPNRDLTVEVSWSKPAVNQFVRDVAAETNRDPVDATVAPGPDSLTVVDEENGLKLRDRLLDRDLKSTLASGSARRTIVARTRVLKPEVTRGEVTSSYPTYITISKASYTLTLWKDLEATVSYPVAVGSAEYPTPNGLFSIQNMQVDPPWNVPNSDWAGDLAGTTIPGGSPENPLVARWMGVSGPVGIHGTSSTSSLGSSASHGCIRMSPTDVIALYDQVDVGTPVYIG